MGVDVAKGALIVLVVLWHVIQKSYLQIDWRIGVPLPGVWGTIADITYPVRMPLFFVISGCLAAAAVARPWRAVVRDRVVKFLYLYLLWSLIHAAAMWAFPDFPTLVPRTLADFLEAVTISPPNAWYLYALALYFVVAKLVRRWPAWVPLIATGALTIVVGMGALPDASNRGSLLANVLFFLVGVRFTAQIRAFAAAPRPRTAALAAVGFLAAYALVRATGAQHVPGAWPLLSVLGVVAGLAVAPLLAGVDRLRRPLSWLGKRTLPIYVIHMPLLVVADAVLVGWISDARTAVQLVAAAILPILLTAAIVGASALLGDLIARDRLYWLLELPGRRTRAAAPADPPGKQPDPHLRRDARRVPWRTPIAVAAVVAVGALTVGAAALPGPGADTPQQPATRAGEVSIGATGDILVYDASSGVPADRGQHQFERVRDWMREDIVTGNLEQALTRNVDHDKCSALAECLAFRSEPDAAAALAGFDIVNLANNHSRDFGQAGYDDTVAALDAAGIRAVGGRDEVRYTKVGDTTVAMLGFAPYAGFNRLTDLRHVSRVVRAAAAHADIVVVHAHMGAEGAGADVVSPGTETMYGENRGDPMAFARAAVDAGADLVIGHGPHVLRGMEWYRGRLIAYSLGNFGGGGVFGRQPETRFGGYLSVRLRADGTLVGGEVRSVRFEQADGIPTPDPHGAAAQLITERGERDFGAVAVRVSETGELIVPR